MMYEQNLELKAGSLVIFTSGAYSSYGMQGAFVVLQDVKHSEVKALEAEIKAEYQARTAFYDEEGKFIARMISKGWLLSLTMREIHLGDYDLCVTDNT